MFKALFNKKAKSRDLRFVDSETYSDQRTARFEQAFDADDETFISVEPQSLNSELTEYAPENSFLEQIKHVTSQARFVDNKSPNENENESIELKRPENALYDFDFDEASLTSKDEQQSLGVFSDSKIYSALIQSVLSNYHLNIKHFNHPNTLKPASYAFFDSISTWIIFLSDENDCDFLDKFLDRYVDKPALFLFSKLNKKASVNRIEQFIQQHNLDLSMSAESLYELNN